MNPEPNLNDQHTSDHAANPEANPWLLSENLPQGYRQQSEEQPSTLRQPNQPLLPQQLLLSPEQQHHLLQMEMNHRNTVIELQQQLASQQEEAYQRQQQWQQERDNTLAEINRRHQEELEQMTQNMHTMYEQLRNTSPTNQQIQPLTQQLSTLLSALEAHEHRRETSQQELFSRIEEWRTSTEGAQSVASLEETRANRDEILISTLQSLTEMLQQQRTQHLQQPSNSTARGSTISRQLSRLPVDLQRPLCSESSSERDEHFTTSSDHGASDHDGSSEDRRTMVRVARQNDTSVRKSRRRMEVPVFKGQATEDPFSWLLVFEKAGEYYEWDDNDKVKEFMVSMQGQAVYWWDGLTAEEKRKSRDSNQQH
ncbi:hypothetical protein BJV82DRAFT_584479 [Fennellomyces sp. T-0311]|nr:hypothetical protein BJV82DRAFT_584479 [Fennellomyces sp. T-0311]